MTTDELINELRQRLAEAKQVKSQAYDRYAAEPATPDKQKLKIQWSHACMRVRDLAGAISTIVDEGLAG